MHPTRLTSIPVWQDASTEKVRIGVAISRITYANDKITINHVVIVDKGDYVGSQSGYGVIQRMRFPWSWFRNPFERY